MKAKISPLVWLNFALLNSTFQVVPYNGRKKKIDPEELFKEFELDVDFFVKDSDEEGDDTFQVFTKISINHGSISVAGYKIFVEGTGLFRITHTAEMPDVHKYNLKNYSAINLLINRLRTHILQTTGLSVYGAYDLPPLDISDLFKQKADLSKQEQLE